eukprot:6794639-Karenia_brevis.AAC.1
MREICTTYKGQFLGCTELSDALKWLLTVINSQFPAIWVTLAADATEAHSNLQYLPKEVEPYFGSSGNLEQFIAMRSCY